MNERVRITLMILVVILCGLIATTYGRISLATLADQPGLTGTYHYYYRMDRTVFAVYHAWATLSPLILMGLIICGGINGKRRSVTRAFLWFAVFLIVLAVCELYLTTRFIPKG